MSDLSRRAFLDRSTSFALGFAGLAAAGQNRVLGETSRVLASSSRSRGGAGLISPLGPLISDKAKILDLPEGFTYQVLSKTGATMDDGFLVPAKHDGMAAFPAPNAPHLTILVRNHEIEHAHGAPGPWGTQDQLYSKIDPASVYDNGYGKVPNRGGTTTLVYDTKEKQLVRQFLSLAGTMRNCAGGPTPRHSWITCEETDARASADTYERSHGYAFEVPATLEPALAKPEPLRAMGRFYREACAIHDRTGIVYQTEDQFDAPIYRFIPNNKDDLHAGGKLQALVIDGMPAAKTGNFEGRDIPLNTPMPVKWIAMDDPEAVGSSLRSRAIRDGAARFARSEGMWSTPDAIYWICTEGGLRGKDGSAMGQLWKYIPSPYEGTDQESTTPGTVALMVEPNDSNIMDHPDNITAAPWGDLVVCEDGPGEEFLLGITPAGEIYRIARNALNTSEFAGAAFSPDGSTLFVNIQNPGFTLAITGPWPRSKS